MQKASSKMNMDIKKENVQPKQANARGLGVNFNRLKQDEDDN